MEDATPRRQMVCPAPPSVPTTDPAFGLCHGVYEHTSGYHVHMRPTIRGSEYVDRCPQCQTVQRVDWDPDAAAWQVMPHDAKGA